MVGNACGRLQQQAESLTGRYAPCCAAGSGPPLPYLDSPKSLAESLLGANRARPERTTGGHRGLASHGPSRTPVASATPCGLG